MIELSSIPNECKTDHLFLLVGANPLPNFVAASLLHNPGATIYLLHTDTTLKIAEHLSNRLRHHYPQLKIVLGEIDTTDNEKIDKAIRQILGVIPERASLGLHYTGGTKAMSVHAYRAIVEQRPDAVFTYLDAQTLSLRIDGRAGEPMKTVKVSDKCNVDLSTLAQLHGYAGVDPAPKVANEARNSIIDALLQIHMDKAGCEKWRAYASASKFQTLPTKDDYPDLLPFIAITEQICQGQPSPDQLAMKLGLYPKLASYSKWLIGEWLEEYVYQHLQAIRTKVQLFDATFGIKPKLTTKSGENRGFDLDVAAMRGYQLFAISCRAAYGKPEAKEHLMEVYVRARQLGGDEARIGLVCFYDKPHRLQAEIEENWYTEGRVQVFGKEHLARLSDHFRDWILKASLQI
jgi:hypothetical protein